MQVLNATTIRTLEEVSAGNGIPACFLTAECERIMQHAVPCMDQWQPGCHGALAIYLAHPGLLMDGNHHVAAHLLQQDADLALPGGQTASFCDLFASHAAPAMRQILLGRSMLRTRRPAATAKLEAAIQDLLAKPQQPSIISNLQQKVQSALRKQASPHKQHSPRSSSCSERIPAVHR